jgi:hypothetical protein
MVDLWITTCEVAVHPSDKNDIHQFYLMCDDVKLLVEKMRITASSAAPFKMKDGF